MEENYIKPFLFLLFFFYFYVCYNYCNPLIYTHTYKNKYDLIGYLIAYFYAIIFPSVLFILFIFT